MVAFLVVRLLHIGQGLISVVTGASAYRPEALAIGVLIAAMVESTGVAVTDLRSGYHTPRAAVGDAAFSLIGMVALGAATMPSDRTTSLNWMLPYGVGAAVGLGLSMPCIRGALISVGLAVAYVATTVHNISEGSGPAAAALANAVSLPGFFLAAALVVTTAARFAHRYDEARRQASDAREQLATLQERRRHQRLIHDSVLQTLEAMAAGRIEGERAMRARARAEAAVLRTTLEGGPPREGLTANLHELVRSLEASSALRVEVVADEGVPPPPPPVAAALVDAAREALTNVAKHAEAKRAVLRLRARRDSIEVVVTDQGRGFDVATTPEGFGLTQSVRARLAEVGGDAEISSEPGMGTRARLWGPLA